MAGVALVAFLLADGAANWTGFNPDESRWLSRANYLSALRDPFSPTWDDQYMTRGQPPLGSYAVGLGLLLQGRDLRTNPPWDFALTWEENFAIGNQPEPADLAAGRRTSAAFVALTAVALIAVARVFLSMPGAILAGTLFAVHPFTTYIGSLAMSDALFGLCIALAAWAAAALARDPHWPRAVLLGSLLGLGGATKLSPLAVAAGLSVAALGALLVAIWRAAPDVARAKRFARRGLIVSAAAAVTFVAVYPYLWPDPAGRARNLFAFRGAEMAAQAADWPVMAVPTRGEALHRVALNFTERFNLSAAVVDWLGGPPLPAAARSLEFLVALAGIALLARLAVRDGPYSPRMLAFLVLGGQVAVTILGMRSEFDRYHVPMGLLGAIAAAAALEWITLLTLSRVPAAALLDVRAAGRRSPARAAAGRTDPGSGQRHGRGHGNHERRGGGIDGERGRENRCGSSRAANGQC